MVKFQTVLAGCAALFLFCFATTTLEATIVAQNEAEIVADNWLRFVVERDGNWAGSMNPVIGQFGAFRRGDMLLGYYAGVHPQGYVIISSLKEFAPVKAYSTMSDLDPDNETGMCDLLKDVLSARNAFLAGMFGGLDDASLQTLHRFTRDENRRLWTCLTEGGISMKATLQSVRAETAGPVGPLMESFWHQGEPFNDACPDMQCAGAFNHNAKVGCVPLAMAQIMRYYCWPPFFQSQYYDWPNMLVNEANYLNGSNWYADENGVRWTQAQVDGVADLCCDAGRILEDIDYSCESTGAFVCKDGNHDARDALEDDFFYDTSDDEPDCEDRDDHSYAEWWSIITGEISNNRPMVYGIDNEDLDFHHAIVVDGYDDLSGGHKVHANYGWGDNGHTAWYELDWFDCNNDDTAYTRCEWDTEEMIRDIYPRDGLNGPYSGTLGTWGGTGTFHHYIYGNVTSGNMAVEAGARVQFLPGVSLTCSDNFIDINGGTRFETRLFSRGDPTRGLKVAQGGKIWLKPNGSICVY